MNNNKIRPRLSIIELRMIVTDMEKQNYNYDKHNENAHLEFLYRLRNYLFPKKATPSFLRKKTYNKHKENK